jgi:hypothetical protein
MANKCGKYCQAINQKYSYSMKLERKEASQWEVDIVSQSVNRIQVVGLIDQLERVNQSTYLSVGSN